MHYTVPRAKFQAHILINLKRELLTKILALNICIDEK